MILYSVSHTCRMFHQTWDCLDPFLCCCAISFAFPFVLPFVFAGDQRDVVHRIVDRTFFGCHFTCSRSHDQSSARLEVRVDFNSHFVVSLGVAPLLRSWRSSCCIEHFFFPRLQVLNRDPPSFFRRHFLGEAGQWRWTSCDMCAVSGWSTRQNTMDKGSEPQAPARGRRNKLPNSWNSLTEHLDGHLTSGSVRELSLFLAWNGHVRFIPVHKDCSFSWRKAVGIAHLETRDQPAVR